MPYGSFGKMPESPEMKRSSACHANRPNTFSPPLLVYVHILNSAEFDY